MNNQPVIQQYLAANPYKAPQQTKQPQQKGNFLTHLLPSLGGIGGAAGGAAIGTGILPGIGTLAGALIGGAVGGGGAKVGENAIEHQKLTNGVAGQAVEQGILGAGPIKLLKGATLGTKAAIDVAKEGGGLASALNAVGDKATTPLIGKQAAKTGLALQGEARGIKPGVTQSGTSSRLTPAQSDKINQYLNDLGAKNSAHTQVRAVANDLKSSGKQISDLVAQHDRTLSQPEIDTIKQEAQAAASKTLGFNAKDPLIVDTQKRVEALAKNGNLSQAKDLRDTLDNQLKSFYSKGERNTTTTTAVENTLKGYRDGINKVLQKGVPGFKEANDRYATGLKAQDLLLKSANPQGLKILGVQTGVGGEGLQAAKDLTGRTLNKTSQSANNNAAKSFGVGAISKRVLPVGGTQAALSSNTPQQVSQQTSLQSPTDLTGAITQAQNNTQQSQTQTNPYSQENLLADIQRDPANASKYIDYYNQLDKIFNPSQTTQTQTPVSKPSAQQYSLASSALGSIQNVMNAIQQDPNIVNKDATPGQGLPGVGGLISRAAGTSDYHTQLANISQAILHLQTGAAFSNEEKKAVQANLPRAGDSAETIQTKLNTLVSFLSPFIPSQQPQQSNQDLTSALLQAGGAQ